MRFWKVLRVTLRGTLALALLGVCTQADGVYKSTPKVNADAQIVTQFQKRVADYVKLHKDVGAQLPPLKPTDSPAKIDEYQRALADRIRAARPNARQGAIFDARIAAEFRRLIRIASRGSHAKLIRASLRRGEPVSLPLAANEAYPERVPLETTPPSLLLNFPKLPPEVDYRVVGHDLVLRDVAANLIVDFVPNVIP